ALPGDVLRRAGGQRPAPQVDDVAAEVDGDVDGVVDEPGALLRTLGGDEGRLVLAPRVEDVPRAGLDGDGEAEPLEQRRGLRDPAGEPGRERVEVLVVEGEGDALVPELGDDGEGVRQPVVGEPVRPVGQAHGHVGEIPFAAARNRGPAAMRPAAAPTAPPPATSAAWRGTMPRMPTPVARRAAAAVGVRTASAWARPTVAA